LRRRPGVPGKPGFGLAGWRLSRSKAERHTTLRFIPTFPKNILLLHAGINALLPRFAWCTKQGHRAMPSYMQIEKGETLMKTALIRILTIATLATSISAFAADEPKSNETAITSANTQQEGCAGVAHKEKKQKKAKSQRDEQTEQEKEFDHVLMGYFG
jgi:uncharacterized membrane protein